MRMELSPNCPAHHAELPQGKMKARSQRRRGRGREEGQKKRWMSAEQARLLELNFKSERKLESARKERLAVDLGLEPQQVAVWFQNRRVKWRSQQLEEEYMRLKSMYQLMLAENCMLQEEVLKLREQLSAAQEEIVKISSDCYNMVRVQDQSSRIPSSSLPMCATDNLFDDFGNYDFLHTPGQLHTCYSINGWII